jgi:PAS domain-containing protein
MKAAPAPSSSESSPLAAGSCQQELADFQEQVRILEAIADRMPYAWYVHDVTTNRCVWSGSGSAGMLPCSDGQPRGVPQTVAHVGPEQVLPGDLHPDDLDVLADRRQRIAQMRDGETIGTEYRVRVAGAWRRFYCRDSVVARDENGAPRHVFSFIEELAWCPADAVPPAVSGQADTLVFQYLDYCTGQQDSPEICQKVLDFVPVGLALLERGSGRLVWANRAYARHLGQPQPAAGTGATRLQQFAAALEVLAVSGETLPINAWPIARALRGETFDDYQVLLRHRVSGRIWPASFDSRPLVDPRHTRRLTLLLLHAPQQRGQPENCTGRRNHANAHPAPDFAAEMDDLNVPPVNLAALARDAHPQADLDRRATPGSKPIIYVAGPGDSLEAGC